MTTEDICNESPFLAPEPLDPNRDCIIKVVGVGGGGGNAVGYMYNQKIKDVKFVVCNTDSQALKISPVPDRVLIGSTGLGAGDKPEVAAAAAEESIDAIREIFNDKTRMVFITAGMGGGTGTGAAPIVARVAREMGILTVGIVTIPFFFEGTPKITKALEGANEMRKYVDALLLINNERLIEIFPDLDFDSAFDKADDTLATAARSISELITNSDVRINVDFQDVDTTLRNGGSAIISCGYGEGPNRVQMAIEDALTSPLLKNSNIGSAKRLLINLAISRTANKKFSIGEMHAFTAFTTSIEDVAVIPGVSYDNDLGDKVKITILASGFDSEIAPVKVQKPAAAKPDGADETPAKPIAIDPITTIRKEYGDVYVARIEEQKARNLYVVLKPEQFDNDAVIEALEAYPAYSRSKEQKETITSMTAGGEVVKPKAAAKPAAEPETDSDRIVF